MSRLQRFIIFGFLIAAAALVYMEASKPEPVNWFPSYNHDDKIPLGSYVLFELMDAALGDDLEEVELPPFEKLSEEDFQGTYFFINDYLSFEEAELNRLLDWVDRGNTLFVSAHSYGRLLLDTLGLDINNAFLMDRVGTEPMVSLVNERFNEEKPYHIQRDFNVSFFETIDTLNQTVLGIAQPFRDTLHIDSPKVNFVEAPVGDGTIYLHLQPEIFSNYFLLTDTHALHTMNVLSYINNGRQIYWDRYYKSGKRINVSPLYILLNNKYLRWAYYFVLIGAALFVLFEGKRKQRSIPIVKPPSNKTYEYTRTISGMYLDKKDYGAIAHKIIVLFLEFVRTRLRVPTEIINSRFYETVAARSGNTIEDTKKLFTFIEAVQKQQPLSKETLIKLNREIDEFKRQLDGKH